MFRGHPRLLRVELVALLSRGECGGGERALGGAQPRSVLRTCARLGGGERRLAGAQHGRVRAQLRLDREQSLCLPVLRLFALPLAQRVLPLHRVEQPSRHALAAVGSGFGAHAAPARRPRRARAVRSRRPAVGSCGRGGRRLVGVDSARARAARRRERRLEELEQDERERAGRAAERAFAGFAADGVQRHVQPQLATPDGRDGGRDAARGGGARRATKRRRERYGRGRHGEQLDKINSPSRNRLIRRVPVAMP